MSIKEFPSRGLSLPYLPLANIHLLYRPGHYDLLYPLSNSEVAEVLPKAEPSPILPENIDPIDTRNVSVGCIFPTLQKASGFLPIYETIYEVVENDFLVLGATQRASSRSSSSSDHPYLEIDTFTIHKYNNEEAPTLLEQTVSLSRAKFGIPSSREIKFIPVMDTSLDYLFQDEWNNLRVIQQIIAAVEHVTPCQISIVGITKFENYYIPVNKYGEISSYLELFAVVDWEQYGTPNLQKPEDIFSEKLLKSVSGYLKLNCPKFTLLNLVVGVQEKSFPNLSCELSINIKFEICGTNETLIMAVPISLFASINEFAAFVRIKFKISPQCCVQFSISTSNSLENIILWNGEEIFHYCMQSKDEIPHLFLKYCEMSEEGIACETISGTSKMSQICRINGCNHHVCQLCLLRHLVLYSNDRN